MATGDKSGKFDTDQQYLGTVYAKALLGATEKAGNSEAVIAELGSFVTEVLDKLPKLESLLSSAAYHILEKISIMEKAFREVMSLQLLNFLKVVVEHGRFDCLRAIDRTARRMFNEARGRVEVELRTAEALSPELLSAVTSRLEAALGRQVELTMQVVPELIGGIVVRVGDTVYDGSLTNQLNRLRSTTLEKAKQEIHDALERFALAD